MSFSAEVKEELAEMVPSEFSLFTAELQGLLLYGAKLTEKEGGTELRFLSEHEESAKKYFTFIRKTALDYENGELQIGRKAEQKLSGEEERRAFLRGAFLAAGSVSDPERFYHLEFVCPDENKAWYLKLLLSALGETAGVVQRKGHYVVYL